MVARITRAILLILVLVVGSGHFANMNVSAEEEITNLVVSKNEVSLEVGATINITATAIYTNNSTENVTVKTQWNSGSPDVATVYAGAITGKKEGTAVITATFLGKTVIINVTVNKRVKSLTKDKQSVDLRLDKTDTVKLTAYYDDGSFEDVTAKADWISDNNSIATVTNGIVKGLGAGITTIKASYNNQSLSLPVNVEIVKRIDATKSQLSLLLKGEEIIVLNATYPDGSVVDVADKAVWETDKPAVADVLKGKVTGYGPGQATLTATYGTKQTTIKVDVDNAIKLDVDRQDLFMKKGSTEQLEITATYPNQDTEKITDRVEWSSSNENVVYVLKGKLSANAVGEATITAKYGEKSITTVVDVDVPRRLDINKEIFSLQSGQTDLIKIEATYANGTKEDVTDRVTWAVENEAIAFITKGKITAYKAGESKITANYGEKTITAKLQVDIPTMLKPSKKTVNFQVGDSEQITLIAVYGDKEEDVTNKAEWITSSSENVAVTNGKITGIATGAATVTAKLGTVTTTVKISVGVLTSLTADHEQLVMEKGDTQQVKLTAKYTDGTTKEITDEATWASADPKTATVDGGNVTSLASGETTITATVESKTVTILVQVDMATALNTSVSYLVLDLGETKQITVTAADSSEETKDVTAEAEWKTSNAQVVQVSNGAVSPVSRGKATITATYGGKTVSIPVEVGLVQTLEADQRFIAAKKGQTVKVQLTATLSDGSTRDVTSSATWKVAAYKVANVVDGALTASGPGKTTLTAAFGGKSVAIPVEVDTLKYLKTNVVKIELKEGEEAQLQAMGTYADGTEDDVTLPSMWNSPNIMIADVKDGIIRATGKGMVRVTVVYSNLRTTVQVTVK